MLTRRRGREHEPVPPSTGSALEVRGLRKRYGHHQVLAGVDLTIGDHELVALVGENGSGKSTLVKCIARAIEPDAGTIRIGGRPLGATASEVQEQGVAVVWQDLALCDNLDTVANLFLGRELRGRFGRRGRSAAPDWPRPEAGVAADGPHAPFSPPRRGMVLNDGDMREAAQAAMAELGARVDDLGAPVSTLSGGQRQSVALARALLDRHRLLILDEPTGGLDRQGSASVERLIRRHRAAGVAVLLVSHDLEAVCSLADRVIVLRGGVIVADLPTTEIQPDDLVAAMSGLQVDSIARRQLRRLHSLVDQLADVEPSRTLPLIVSAMAAALDQERLCVHLVDQADTTPGPPMLRRSASVGIPPELLAVNEVVPVGRIGGMVGLAAERGEVVIVEDVRAERGSRAEQAALACGLVSAWAAPIEGSGGVLGTVSGYGESIGCPAADQLELVSLYASHAAAAIEREGLLQQVTRRNRILETLGGVLEILAGPDASSGGLDVALDALQRGLGGPSLCLFERRAGALLPRGADRVAGSDQDPSAGGDVVQSESDKVGGSQTVVAARLDGSPLPGSSGGVRWPVPAVGSSGPQPSVGDVVVQPESDNGQRPGSDVAAHDLAGAAKAILARKAQREMAEAAQAAVLGGEARPSAHLVAVPIDLPEGRGALVARWDPAAAPSDDRIELLRDASHSLRLAIERSALDVAREEATMLRRSHAFQRDFLLRLSHELRTPLTAIYGYADTLRQPDVDWGPAPTRRFLDSIASESARLGRLVSDLLDASALDTGLLRFDPAWCDLTLVVEAAAACVPVTAPSTVEVRCTPDLVPIRADHDRLEQVLVNLIDNAVRHNPPGTRVRVTASNIPGNQVEVRVVDDGVGGTGEPDPSPSVGRGEGSGLGLTIARGIVEAHRGRLEFEPVERGTIAVVTLPVDPPDLPTVDAE
jgi:ABC-type multidrug transport system ATPase subunit/signal transduction histidine kinase